MLTARSAYSPDYFQRSIWDREHLLLFRNLVSGCHTYRAAGLVQKQRVLT